MTPPFYDAEEVAALLDIPGCIAVMHRAMIDLSTRGRPQPLRQIVDLGGTDKLGLMPGDITDAFGAKLVSVFGDAVDEGRSRHQGVVVVFETTHGALACLADAEAVTKIRTGCASAAATDVLARPDVTVAAIFGTGLQAESHARALCHVRPLQHVLLWGRSLDRARALAVRLEEELGVSFEATTDGHHAASSADIICTVTGSIAPILLGEWVRPGTHVNLVGSSYLGPVEVDPALVAAARYFGDHRPSVLAQAAEFAEARERGLVDHSHLLVEIGEVFAGSIVGRRSSDDITIYKSLGHATQDLAAVAYIHRRAANEARRPTRSLVVD